MRLTGILVPFYTWFTPVIFFWCANDCDLSNLQAFVILQIKVYTNYVFNNRMFFERYKWRAEVNQDKDFNVILSFFPRLLFSLNRTCQFRGMNAIDRTIHL